MFGTVLPPPALQFSSDEEKIAFQKGYSDYQSIRQNHQGLSLATSHNAYAPPPQCTRAYDQGWQQAKEDELTQSQQSQHRSECLNIIVVGFFLFLVGIAITAITYYAAPGGKFYFAYGAILIGGVQILRGIGKFFFPDMIP